MPKYYKKAPYRRRPRRTYKKRVYKKKTYRRHHKHGRRNPNHVRITTMRSTVPSDVIWQKFKYFEQNFHFALGSGDTNNSVIMAMNNPYDPYVSFGGKAANYFEKMMEMYRYARVYAAKITLQITDNFQGNVNPMNFAIFLSPSDAPVAVSTPDDINSLPTNRCKRMSQFQNRIGGTRKLSFYVTIADGFYLSRQQYDSALPANTFDVVNFGGIGSPARLLYAVIFYSKCATTGTLSGSAVECVGNVSMTFYTKLWNRIEFGEAQ